jgi:peptide/nickel transport system permease protein
VNVIAVTAAWLLTGTFVVEVVFNYPGLGRLAVDAIADRDTDLILALTLLGLAVFIGASFLADTVIRLLDPRVRAGAGRA